MGLLALMILIVLAMPLSFAASTKLDYGLTASLTCGLLLLAAGFSAASLYMSSLTTHPVAAALSAFGVLLAMIFMGETAVDGLAARGLHFPAALAQVFSPVKNYEPLGKGVIDSYAIVCLLLLIAIFLTLTVRQLEARRLRG
jgi:ABC-2 type transport system permease protein